MPLGRSSIARGCRQIARYAVQTGFSNPFAGGLDMLRSLNQAIPLFNRLPEHGVNLGEPRQESCPPYGATDGTESCLRLGEQRKSFLRFSAFRQRPSATRQGPSQVMRSPKLDRQSL